MSGHPTIVLAPSVKTEIVTTTTVTTTTYAPISLPPLPKAPVPKDPREYPLLHARLPPSLSQFNITFPDGATAIFTDSEEGLVDGIVPNEAEVNSGKGWRMLSKDEMARSEEVKLAEAIDRFNRKHSGGPDMMEGVESTTKPTHQPQPRRKFKGNNLDLNIRGSRTSAAAPPSPLPSPTGSPAPHQPVWAATPPEDPSNAAHPLSPDLQLATLVSLPTLLAQYTALPPSIQSHILLSLLRHSTLPVLRNVHSVLGPSLSRDFLTQLPPELVSIVLSYLPWPTLARCTRVSKSWRHIIDSDPILWRELLKTTRSWFGGGSENAFARTLSKRRATHEVKGELPSLLPHPFKVLFKSRQLTRTQWPANQNPRRVSFPAHGNSVVTCLLFSHGRIISASDDHSIHVYNPLDGRLIRSLEGHGGGVWALAATKDTLVSGSTDRTVRIWNLETGVCTHVFGGHKSTVRCLAIIKPEYIEMEHDDGGMHRERWPKRTLIVTGSRDHTLRVWKLPKPHEPKYTFVQEEDSDPSEQFVDQNPYHLRLLEGHTHAVRALAAKGRTLVSGSYDCAVRVWDIITGQCKWVLTGHQQKVYSIVLDPVRNQAMSGSMDSSVRIWNLSTGQCVHVLTGHTSLVGLLGLSQSYLVSAAADSTLRVWDPSTGDLLHTLVAHTGAITCFQHDEFKILSGSDGTLKMWDIRSGTNVRDLLTGITGVWQVVFDGRWCVAASNRHDATYLDVWDFGHEVVGDGDEEWCGEASVDGESGASEDEEDVSECWETDRGGSVVPMDQDQEEEVRRSLVNDDDDDSIPQDEIPDSDAMLEEERRRAIENMRESIEEVTRQRSLKNMSQNPETPVLGRSESTPQMELWSTFGEASGSGLGIPGVTPSLPLQPAGRQTRRAAAAANAAVSGVGGYPHGLSGAGPSRGLPLPPSNDESPIKPKTRRK